MRLAVISHKIVWRSKFSRHEFATDGGFPAQIEALSELFDSTRVVVPCDRKPANEGLSPVCGRRLGVVPLSVPMGSGLLRKLRFPGWLLRNGVVIWREVRRADAVHTPIPGDVGTIGMLFALLQKKPLFVRHCGNWFVQRTLAERLWKWAMEHFAGGRNVMLATGGSPDPPSERNRDIAWIFSTSLRREQILSRKMPTFPENGVLRLAIVCRQEPRKGTDVAIRSMPLILKDFPEASLDVVGDGSQLAELKGLSVSLGLGPCVRFHGKLEQKGVLDVLQQAHIFCFPTSASEGFPKAVLEALAMGLPVVTTRVSVLPELIKQGGGILIDRAEPELVANAVGKICSDRYTYSDMSARATETAQNYALEDWKAQIEEKLRASWGVESLAG